MCSFLIISSLFFRIVTPTSALIQSCCQTVLVLDAWRRRCCTEEQIRKKPGRQLITFLLIINISLWVSVRRNDESANMETPYYGNIPWRPIKTRHCSFGGYRSASCISLRPVGIAVSGAVVPTMIAQSLLNLCLMNMLEQLTF